MKRFFLLTAITAAISGCTLFNGFGTDNTPAPAPLVKYQAKLLVTNIWNRNIGYASDGTYLQLSPAYAKGVIYTIDQRGTLMTTNAQGDHLWSKRIEAGGKSGVASDGNIVAFVDTAAVLHVVQAATGKELWHADASNQSLAAPAIADNKVIVKTIDGNVAAFDALSGKSLWTYSHDAPTLILHANSSPLIVGQTVYIGFADGKVAALNLSNGNLLWQQTVASPQGASDVERMVDIDANLIWQNNVLYVSTYQGQLAAIHPQSGAIIWQQAVSCYAGMAMSGNRLFVPLLDGTLVAFDTNNGKKIWEQKALAWRFLSGPAVIDRYLVVGDLQGYLHFLSQEDGSLLARVQHEQASIITAPIVVGNIVYTQDSRGKLSADAVLLQEIHK